MLVTPLDEYRVSMFPPGAVKVGAGIKGIAVADFCMVVFNDFNPSGKTEEPINKKGSVIVKKSYIYNAT